MFNSTQQSLILTTPWLAIHILFKQSTLYRIISSKKKKKKEGSCVFLTTSTHVLVEFLSDPSGAFQVSLHNTYVEYRIMHISNFALNFSFTLLEEIQLRSSQQGLHVNIIGQLYLATLNQIGHTQKTSCRENIYMSA